MSAITKFSFLLAALGVTTVANAADLPSRKSPPYLAMPAAFSWTGAYIGVQVGGSWGNDHTVEYLTANGAFTGAQWKYNVNGAFGAVRLGYNQQWGSFVAGVEGDVELGNIRGGFVDPGGRGVAQATWQGSLRARAGFAWDRVLIFATGGLALADIRYTYTNPLGASEASTGLRTGYALGGGLEYAFTNNLIGSVEYRYTNFGKFSYVAQSAFLGLTGTQQPQFHTARVGISYKF